MARPVDFVKLRLWQQRLRRFERSNLTVAAFCQAEDVSLPSFYHWRSKLDAPEEPIGVRRHVAPRDAERTAGSKHAFLPVQVIAAATIEIHLPNGARLAVPTGDQATLEATIAAVGRLPRTPNAENKGC